MTESLNTQIFSLVVKIRPFIRPVLFAFAVGLGMGFLAAKLGILGVREGTVGCTEIQAVQSPSAASTEQSDINPSETKEGGVCDFKVDVAGAVAIPGVYCLAEGSTIDDAIKKAGDINKDLFAFKFVSQKMNFAKQIVSEQKIYIPYQDDVDCTLKTEKVDYQEIVNAGLSTDVQQSANVKDTLNSNINQLCVSLNNASIEELDTLDGVGIATAQKIIQGRPYKVVEDLLNVKGIGQATFDKLKSRLCI